MTSRGSGDWRGLTVKVAEAAGSLLSRHGGRVGYVAQVGGALLAPQRIKEFFGNRCNVD